MTSEIPGGDLWRIRVLRIRAFCECLHGCFSDFLSDSANGPDAHAHAAVRFHRRLVAHPIDSSVGQLYHERSHRRHRTINYPTCIWWQVEVDGFIVRGICVYRK